MLDDKTAAHLKSIFEMGYHYKLLTGRIINMLSQTADMQDVDNVKGVIAEVMGYYLMYDFSAEVTAQSPFETESDEVE